MVLQTFRVEEFSFRIKEGFLEDVVFGQCFERYVWELIRRGEWEKSVLDRQVWICLVY